MSLIDNRLATLLPTRRDLWKGLAIAVGLWCFFMIATAYTSAATLLDRVASTDVMKAASGSAWSSVLVWQALSFLGAQLLLHLAFALACWLLALATDGRCAEAGRKIWTHCGWLVLRPGGSCPYIQRSLVSKDSHRRVLPPRRVATNRACVPWSVGLLRGFRFLCPDSPACVPADTAISDTCGAPHFIGELGFRCNGLDCHGDVAQPAVCGCSRTRRTSSSRHCDRNRLAATG